MGAGQSKLQDPPYKVEVGQDVYVVSGEDKIGRIHSLRWGDKVTISSDAMRGRSVRVHGRLFKYFCSWQMAYSELSKSKPPFSRGQVVWFAGEQNLSLPCGRVVEWGESGEVVRGATSVDCMGAGFDVKFRGHTDLVSIPYRDLCGAEPPLSRGQHVWYIGAQRPLSHGDAIRWGAKGSVVRAHQNFPGWPACYFGTEPTWEIEIQFDGRPTAVPLKDNELSTRAFCKGAMVRFDGKDSNLTDCDVLIHGTTGRVIAGNQKHVQVLFPHNHTPAPIEYEHLTLVDKVLDEVQDKMEQVGRFRRSVQSAKVAGNLTNDLRNQLIHATQEAVKSAKAAIVPPSHWQQSNERHQKAYLLASAPEYDVNEFPVLEVASSVLKYLGEKNVAGDAKDDFHQKIMSPQEMTQERKGWRNAWQGKVSTGIDFTYQDCPSCTIVLVTLQGGQECDWEQYQIAQHIIPSFTGRGVRLETKHFRSWRDLIRFLATASIRRKSLEQILESLWRSMGPSSRSRWLRAFVNQI